MITPEMEEAAKAKDVDQLESMASDIASKACADSYRSHGILGGSHYDCAKRAALAGLRAGMAAAGWQPIAKFAEACIRPAFEGGGLDGAEVQDLAVQYGLIYEVKFDPAKHYDPDGYAEEDDEWYEYTDLFRAMISAAPVSPAAQEGGE